MSSRKLRNTSELLDASKGALRQLMTAPEPLPRELRTTIVRTLTEAIEKVEGPQEWRLEFVTTPRTAELLFEGLRNAPFNSAAEVAGWLKSGKRETARRIYFSVPVDITLCRDLATYLHIVNPGSATSRAFDRIADQIREEVLDKSPLAALADAGV